MHGKSSSRRLVVSWPFTKCAWRSPLLPGFSGFGFLGRRVWHRCQVSTHNHKCVPLVEHGGRSGQICVQLQSKIKAGSCQSVQLSSKIKTEATEVSVCRRIGPENWQLSKTDETRESNLATAQHTCSAGIASGNLGTSWPLGSAGSSSSAAQLETDLAPLFAQIWDTGSGIYFVHNCNTHVVRALAAKFVVQM